MMPPLLHGNLGTGIWLLAAVLLFYIDVLLCNVLFCYKH